MPRHVAPRHACGLPPVSSTPLSEGISGRLLAGSAAELLLLLLLDGLLLLLELLLAAVRSRQSGCDLARRCLQAGLTTSDAYWGLRSALLENGTALRVSKGPRTKGRPALNILTQANRVVTA